MSTPALEVPAGVPSDGSWKVAFVPTIEDPSAPKIATEIKAAGSVDGSCLLTKQGIAIGQNVEKFTDERLCTINVYEQNGAITWSIDDLEFVIDPQGGASSATNKLYALLSGDTGWSGFIVIRAGLFSANDWTTTDTGWVFPVHIAPPYPLPPEKNTQLRARASVSVTGEVRRDVSLAA